MQFIFHEKQRYWLWNGVRVTGLPEGTVHAPTNLPKGSCGASSSSAPPPTILREPTTSIGCMKKFWYMLEMRLGIKLANDRLDFIYQAKRHSYGESPLFVDPPLVPCEESDEDNTNDNDGDGDDDGDDDIHEEE